MAERERRRGDNVGEHVTVSTKSMERNGTLPYHWGAHHILALSPSQLKQQQQEQQQQQQQEGNRIAVGGGLSLPTQEQLRERPLLSRLPYFKPWYVKKGGDVPLVNPTWMVESCGVRVVMGTGGGWAMGIVFGVFLGAMGDMQPIQMLNGREVPQAPLREQIRAAYKQTAERSLRLGRNFASFSAVFMSTECIIEKMRGKHDIMNAVYSGCATGAALGVKQGPQAACVGCLGLAAFSAIMETVMGH